jgi:hypothetical protein
MIPTAAVEMNLVENSVDNFRPQSVIVPEFPTRDRISHKISANFSLVEKLCTLCGARNFFR